MRTWISRGIDLIRGAFFAVVLGCTALCAAQAEARSLGAARQSDFQGVEVWLSGVARWSQSYQSIQNRQSDVIEDVLNGFERAIHYQTTGDVQGGRAWAAEWRTGVDSDLAGLRTYLAGLDPLPPEPPSGMAPDVLEAVDGMRTRFRSVAPSFHQMNEDFIRDVSAMADMIEGVAVGDARAVAESEGVLLTTGIAMSRSAVTVMTTALDLVPDPDHPHAHMLRGAIASEQAMIAAFAFLKADFQGGRPSAEAAAAEIRAFADQMDGHAEAMERSSQVMEARMRRAAGSAVSESLYQSIATYRESAALDRQFAEEVRRMASLIERREDRISPQFQETFARIEQFTIRRFELDTLRRALVAG